MNKRKVQLFQSEVTFLGQSIGREGKRPLPDRVIAITQLNKPTTVTGLRSLMGLFNFNRMYIPDFSDLAKPLTEALKGGLPGASPLEWTADMAESFTLLKSALLSSPALYQPDMTKAFHV